MAEYNITSENSIYNLRPNRNAISIYGDDHLIVHQGGMIYTGEEGNYGVYASGGNLNIEVHGTVRSDGWHAINVWGSPTSHNVVLIGSTGVVQGSSEAGRSAIKVYGGGFVSNSGYINGYGAVGVNFYDIYEYAPGATKTLDNYGFIGGQSASVQGGVGKDVIVNHVGAELSGNVYLGLGDDIFWMGGKCSVVYLGGGNDTVGVLQGASVNHSIFGEGGDDLLTGGAGWDVLYGGSGNDLFVFNNAMGSTYDKIADFESGKDRISLDRNKFTKLTAGVVQSFAGREADLKGPGLFYDYQGELNYDSDGAGGEAPITIAWLGGRPTLLPSDIFVI